MYYKTCESVTEGHPDKICDQISDAILDAYITGDPYTRAGVECLIKDNKLVIGGEVTSKTDVDIIAIAKGVLKDVGYTDELIATYEMVNWVGKQSPDISQGVDRDGAGDQGMMYGYACTETEEMIPLPLSLSHKICKKLAEVRRADANSPLLSDGKAQVTVEYIDGQGPKISTVVVSSQHDAVVSQEDLYKYINEKVIQPVCAGYLREKQVINPHFLETAVEDNTTKIFINPTGRFEVGGPFGDCGVTGRKIVVDTYGGIGRVGGGCFSGKDPSKVDRSAAYMARYVAKKLVKEGYGDEIEVRLAYSIGVSDPVDVSVSILTGDRSKEAEAVEYIKKNFKLNPRAIIEFLDLRKPIYYKTAAYGHFGRNEFSWEK